MQYKFSLPEGITVNLIDGVPVSLEWRVQCDAYEQLDADGKPIILAQADTGYKVDGDDVPNWPLTPTKQKALVILYMKAVGNSDEVSAAEEAHANESEPVVPAPVTRVQQLKEMAAPAGEPPVKPVASTEVTEYDGTLELE